MTPVRLPHLGLPALPRPAAVAALAALAALASALPAPARAGGERVRDSSEQNYLLRIPDRWQWGDAEPFAKDGVAVVADLRLETLADGTTKADGQGGRLMLSVQDVPPSLSPEYETWLMDLQLLEAQADTETEQKGEASDELKKKIGDAEARVAKAMAGLGAVPDVQSLLMKRFDKDPRKWPAGEVDAENVTVGGLPAARVKVSGECSNLAGTNGPCEGRLFVWVIRKKMYRLAMWGWPTARDREHVKDDLDFIEMSFEVPKKTPIPRKGEPPKTGPDAAPADPKLEGDAGETKTVKDTALGFEIVKPRKFRSQPVDRAKDATQGVLFTAEAQGSTALVNLLVFRVGVPGARSFDPDWAKNTARAFLAAHTEGPLDTYPWPPLGEKAPFLSLPDVTKRKEVKRPASEKDLPGSMGDLEKMGVAAEVKNARVGKEKVRDAVRFCFRGNLARVGEETLVDYLFGTSDRMFVMRVSVRKDGWSLWKDELAQIVGSMTILDVAK